MAKPSGFSSGFGSGFGVGRYRYTLAPWTWNTGGPLGNHWGLPSSAVGCVDLRPLPAQALAGGTPQGFAFVASMQPLAGAVPIAHSLNFIDEPATSPMQDAWESELGYRPQGANVVDLLWDQLTAGSDPTGQSGPKPLVPGVDGFLRLFVGGHSQVKAERFQWGVHAHTNRLRDLLRLQFASHHEQHQEHARRILDFWCVRYRVDDWHEFVPANLRAHVPGRLPHATTITESFNTADSTTLGPDLSWTEYSDGSAGNRWEVLSNQVTGVASAGPVGYARAESDLSSDDHYAQLSITTLPTSTSNEQIGARARFDAASITGYDARAASYSMGTNQIILSKQVGATQTNFFLTAADFSGLPKIVKCEADGSNISSYWNGSLVNTQSDSAITGNVRTGLWCFSTGGPGTFSGDSFQAADLAAAAVYSQFWWNLAYNYAGAM